MILEVSNLQLESTTKMFTKSSRKLIRFSYKNNIITSKNTCIYVNDATIKWQQILLLPQVYNQRIDFQIYNQHSFGYNPQELQNILYGSIKFTENKTIGKWEVLSSNLDGKKIGLILYDVKKISKKSKQNKQLTNNQNKTTKMLWSILVRNVVGSPKSGYITVNTGKKNFKSQIVEAIHGEFVFTLTSKNNTYLVRSSNPADKIIATFYQADGKMIGEGQYSFKNENKFMKVDMMDQNAKKNGQMYFQAEVDPNPTQKTQDHMHELQKLQAIDLKKEKLKKLKQINQQKQFTQNSQPKYLKKDPTPNTAQPKESLHKLRSMSLTKLSQIGQSQFLGTLRRKRVSVIHNNNQIYFPTQKRFMNYQDKQTNIISYSRLPNMKFEEQNSYKYYKGASFGKGTKSDFTIYYKNNPGVGQYKLPSIFDRY